jgi:hypothetical protein
MWKILPEHLIDFFLFSSHLTIRPRTQLVLRGQLIPLLTHRVANVRVIGVAALGCVHRSMLEMVLREMAHAPGLQAMFAPMGGGGGDDGDLANAGGKGLSAGATSAVTSAANTNAAASSPSFFSSLFQSSSSASPSSASASNTQTNAPSASSSSSSSSASLALDLSTWSTIAHLHRVWMHGEATVTAADFITRESVRAHMLTVVQRLYQARWLDARQ